MATKAKDIAPKRKPGRPRKPDGRRNNRGVRGNSGGKPGLSGRKEWEPQPIMVRDPATNGMRMQSKDEAWADARALVRHMAAIGTPLEKMGAFMRPAILDEKTLKKHFDWEIENGETQAALNVSGVAYQMAVSGRHESSTWRWLERKVPGFQPKADVNLNGPLAVKLVPGDM